MDLTHQSSHVQHADEEKSHHEFCVSRFQDLDEQIEAVQNHLFELQYGKDD